LHCKFPPDKFEQLYKESMFAVPSCVYTKFGEISVNISSKKNNCHALQFKIR